jgi:hypothetical protein
MKSPAPFLLASLLLLVAALPFPARAAFINGPPAFNAARDAGLYVWRDHGIWRIRLISGSLPRSVSGGLTTTRPFLWTSAVAQERSDTLTRVRPGQIGFGLKVDQKDFLDGIDFKVPDGAGLCLWVWGSFGNTIALGADAASVNPLGVSRSIDLLGNGGCVGGIKFHPGHYVSMNEGDGPAQMLDAIRPGVRGLNRRYYWKDLEPTAGNYDFSAIQADLKLAAKNGVQLIAMIMDKSFTASLNPVPRYLANYTWAVAGGGHVAQRWSPYVVRRLALLTGALGKAFDGNPHFEGIAFQETSLGLTNAAAAASGYTPEGYRDALIQILKNAREALPTSQVFWYMNFIEGNNALLGDIASAIVPFKIAMGGPDILPDNWSLNYWSYPFYRQYAGRLVLFGSVQNVSYSHLHASGWYPTKYWTMGELYWWAKTQLGVSYVFWNRKMTASPSDAYDWWDALPVIRYNPPPFN